MEILTPDWVKHAVFYQIFPDRFARSNQTHPSAASLTFEDWEVPPTHQGYKGGNLWGAIEQLDYLQDLGINAIYFTPIFQSASNHRYHTHDYYQVDVLLGGNEAFRELLQAAHQRGIKVVLDGVFNHASRGFFFFHDILENGSNSPWLNWFKIQGWPLVPYDGDRPANYVSWADSRALPEFNHDHAAAREYVMQVAEYWIKQGIDGWRLDVPNCIKVEGFWQEFRDRVKAINPDAYIVGEIWEEATQWLDGTQFDGVMNYQFTSPTIAFTAGDRVNHKYVHESYQPYPPLDAPSYAAKVENLLKLYPWEIQLTQLNLLDSHDTARLITVVNQDRASVELATLLLITFPGAPSIYYGDEVGLGGGRDPDCRRGFPQQSDWDMEVLDYHRDLIKLRHDHPALQTGSYQILLAEGLVYVFARILDQEVAIVAVNAGTEAATVSFTPKFDRSNPLLYQVIYGAGTVESERDRDRITLDLPMRSGLIAV